MFSSLFLNACQAFSKCDFLLDNEVQGSGFYLPELDDPEHCNAQNTALWELHTLQVHRHGSNIGMLQVHSVQVHKHTHGHINSV